MEFVLFEIGTTFALLLGVVWSDLARSKSDAANELPNSVR
jgi:hypothetical protein